MADDTGGDKSEKASAQKLRKAREQGQVVRSKDLATAVGILASLKLFVLLLPDYLESFRSLFRLVFAPLGAAGSMENAMSVVWRGAAVLLVKMVLPLLGVPLAVAAASMVPGGWVVSTNNLMPKLDRFSPVKNLGQLASGKHWTQFGTLGRQGGAAGARARACGALRAVGLGQPAAHAAVRRAAARRRHDVRRPDGARRRVRAVRADRRAAAGLHVRAQPAHEQAGSEGRIQEHRGQARDPRAHPPAAAAAGARAT